jgi:RHS repeat-associated protein
MPIDIATGDVELAREDFVLPGRVPLIWTRRFRSGLLKSPAPLAPGWTTSLFASMKRVGKEWQFTTGEGELHVFADPEEKVVKGRTLRLLGAFLELVRSDNRLIVTQWDPDSGDIQRFVFAAGRSGGDLTLSLAGIEDVCGDGLELTRDASGRLTMVRQRIEDRTVAVNYSPAGRISSLALVTKGGAPAPLVRYEYDGAGRLSAAFDRGDLANRYEYDAQSRITREVLKDGAIYSYSYDEKGRCIRFSGLDRYNEKRLQFLETARTTIVTNSYGKSSVHQYLAGGQIVSEVDPSGHRQSTAFDEHNRIVEKVDATGAAIRYTYDAHGNRDSVTGALGQTYRFTFNAHHQPLSVTDPLGKTWHREYDARHRLIASRNPLGARWKVGYDEAGNRAAISDPLGSTRRMRYANGLLLEATDWMGHATRFAWDEFGRVTERVGPLGDRTAFRYDSAGHPVEVQLADGGRLRAAYDSGDNLTSFTNAKGHTTRFRYGSCRRLLERVDAIGRVVRYGWGTEPERLDYVINEKGETFTYSRDDQGRIIRERSFDDREQSFEYDGAGRCVAAVNGNGDRIQLTRNAAGAIVEQSLPDGASTSYEYDPVGRLVAAVNQDVALRFEYDDAGRQIRESQGNEWVSTEYNATGEVTRIQTSLGHEVRYELDPDGNITKLITGGDHSLAFERDARGRETGRLMPGGVRLDQRFDVMGRLSEQRVSQTSPSLLPDPNRGRRPRNSSRQEIVKRDYRYDADGLLVSIADGHWGTAAYSYDPAERLLAALSDRGAGEQFEYDAADNVIRARRQGDDESDDSSSYGPGSRLLERGDTRYEYDPDGRLVRRTELAGSAEPRVWQYTWDAQGQLRRVRRPDQAEFEYKYDAFGRRISKHGPDCTRQFLWRGNVVIQEWTAGGLPVAWVLNKGSFAPLAKVSEGSLFTVVNDHLGTPREMLDGSGKVVWSAALSAWGQVERKQTLHREHDCPIRFQGQWYDEESGLHYNRFRYYDPAAGRYISADPIRLRAGLNLFSYALPPTQWIDPFGLAPQCLDVREEDVSGGPHAPDRTMNQVMSRAAGTGKPQGQWGSREAATRAAAQYDPARGGVQVVPIAPGDGTVVHHPVMSYPPRAGEPTVVQGGVTVSRGGPEVVPADHAIIIPKPDGLHTFPIDGTHPQHPSNQP